MSKRWNATIQVDLFATFATLALLSFATLQPARITTSINSSTENASESSEARSKGLPGSTEGRATGWLLDIAVEGREIPSLTDEQRLSAIFSGESTRTDATAGSVSGTWLAQTGPGNLWTWIDDPSQLELTAAGQAALDGFNPTNTRSKASCEPRSVPRVMIAADRKAIELGGDVAWIRAEYDATERIAYFDARPAPGQEGRDALAVSPQRRLRVGSVRSRRHEVFPR